MNARNRIFVILGVLFIISLCWYFFSTDRSEDLQLIGTVDANEVIISSRIPGRIEKLTVDEGDSVQAGELIATIQSEDLAAANRHMRRSPRLQSNSTMNISLTCSSRHIHSNECCRFRPTC